MPTTDLLLPFAHLNLVRNPFGARGLASRAALAVVDVDAFVPWLREPGRTLQFIGEKGHGKTTHVLALRAACGGGPYVHIPEGPQPPIPVAPLLFVDEIQRLTRRVRRQLFRRRASFVFGTHRDFTAELVAAGVRVRTIHPEVALDAERLQRILGRRVEDARRASGPVPRVREETCRRLLQQFGGDIRSIQHHLYEIFQVLPEVRDV